MRLLLNTEAYPDYTQDQLVEWMGLLPHWVADYVEDGGDEEGLDLVDHMTEAYGFGKLYQFKGKVLPNGTYTYPEDDDLNPIAKVKLKKGDVYFYPYGMVALPTDNGHYVTRMD
jgi:hypothetical protein|tara:strand:+ start:181 stop:522 length:342 start_codon:yes stop_codon:yes gene_type:complete